MISNLLVDMFAVGLLFIEGIGDGVLIGMAMTLICIVLFGWGFVSVSSGFLTMVMPSREFESFWIEDIFPVEIEPEQLTLGAGTDYAVATTKVPAYAAGLLLFFVLRRVLVRKGAR